MAIRTDRNVVQREEENKIKYKSLCTEIQGMWNLKCEIIPVKNGATVIKCLRKYLEALPGKH